LEYLLAIVDLNADQRLAQNLNHGTLNSTG
jgi:hypothetical protein